MSHVDDGQLNALLDGELPLGEAHAVEAHLASCALCAKRLEEARQFLSEAADLLDVLAPNLQAADAARPAAPSAGPPAAIPAAATPPAMAPGEPRRVSKTAKEVAVDIDGGTQKSPAIRPIFPREVERVAPAEAAREVRPPRRADWTQLAWAATVVLALGVGYLANEVRHGRITAEGEGRRQSAQVAASPAREGEPVATAGPASETRRGASAAASGGDQITAAAGPRRSVAPGEAPPRVVATKPASARGPKPRPPAADAVPLDRARPAELAHGNLAGLPPSAAAGVAALPAAPVAPAPVQPAPAPSADAAARALAGASRGRLLAHYRADEPAPTPTFRRISLEEAARRQGGSVRLIDGLMLSRVEIGSGRLVTGADPARDVVRVHYADADGRQILLEEQRLPSTEASRAAEVAAAAAPTAAINLAPGDTLVTSQPGGGIVTWMDGRFWLRLSGSVPVDTLRMMVVRVR